MVKVIFEGKNNTVPAGYPNLSCLCWVISHRDASWFMAWRIFPPFYLLSDGGRREVMMTAQPHKTTRFGSAMENTQDGHI